MPTSPIPSLLTAIREHPGVEIELSADGDIVFEISCGGKLPEPADPQFIIRLEGHQSSTEFKVTRLVRRLVRVSDDGGSGRSFVSGSGDTFTPVALCYINSRTLAEAIAARIVAEQNAEQDELIGLVKPVDVVLQGV